MGSLYYDICRYLRQNMYENPQCGNTYAKMIKYKTGYMTIFIDLYDDDINDQTKCSIEVIYHIDNNSRKNDTFVFSTIELFTSFERSLLKWIESNFTIEEYCTNFIY